MLPCVIDVGTDNERLRGDKIYAGMDQPRMKGEEYLQARLSARLACAAAAPAGTMTASARSRLLA